ncbi:unnamed protein product [Cylindrotheca closterium]|uniref:50S ribosomal protein L22, chloroplastic n=1 Tax=Cylindrotheca closterium TaxID=2856 RepID=A0AAD2JL48_9STRA|nr:unnamed protein product [Cylindrotheca closterium]
MFSSTGSLRNSGRMLSGGILCGSGRVKAIAPSLQSLAGPRLCVPVSSFSVMPKIPDDLKQSGSLPQIFSSDGTEYGMLLDTRKMSKLKPSIVQKRLAECKTYEGKEKSIRQSPWKLNRVCQLAAGLTLEEALTQLKFCDIKNADLVAKVLTRTSNLADIKDGLQISQLEVAECFTTKSMMLRRIKPMGRGRHGIMHHKHSHIRVVLREIDFPLRILQQKSLNQKKKWLWYQHRAENDYQASKAKRDEMLRLVEQQEKQELERREGAKGST